MTRIARFPGLAPVLAIAFALAVAGLSFSDQSSAQDIAAQEKPAAKSKKTAGGSGGPQVYLMRGLLNIFSLGMDDLAQKINAKGIKAVVYNHSEWQSVSDQIAAKYKAGDRSAVILIGHSLGADAVMFMGEYLGKKSVPVALIVPFDGTGSFAASSNVQRVMNLTQRDYAHMRRGSGFRGELANIDVSAHGVGHIDIDKSARLHGMVLNKISSIGRGGGTRSAGDGTPAPRSRPASTTPSESSPAQPETAPAGPTAAPQSSPASAPATTASTSGAGSERTASSASPPPARTDKPSASGESSVNAPAKQDGAGKPGIRF